MGQTAESLKTGGTGKSACVLYSGGMDSSTAAIKLLESGDFRHVHLLHVNIGGYVMFERWAGTNWDVFKKRYGEAVSFSTVDAAALSGKIFQNALGDAFRQKELGLVCLTCRLVMHACAIEHARRHGAAVVADGSNRAESDNCVEQRPEILALVSRLYARYGIEYQTPIYDIHGGRTFPRTSFLEKCFGSASMRNPMRENLRKRGFGLGWRWGDLHKFIQPWCLWGSFYIILQSFLGKHDGELVKSYCEKKIEVILRELQPGSPAFPGERARERVRPAAAG